MSKPPEQQNTISPRWWVRLCQWLWSQRGFIWGTLIVGIFVSVAATWLISSTSIFTGTPLGAILLWIHEHLLLAGLIGVILLLFTLLVGAVSHLADTSARPVATASGQQQNRRAFIHLLRHEYRRQMAESLQDTAMMTLALQQRTDVVLSSVSLVSWRMDAPSDHSSLAPASIVQAYDDAGGGLLILGAPGAGKSTLLRELASELLTRAEKDATQSIPVIVNLSSWAIKKLPLTAWLVDQLQLVYTIPHRVGQILVEQDQLLLLLDGLDEMESSARSKCIEAINTYRAEHIVPIVVCSRSHAYLEREERLRVPVAVEVRPLTPAQVESYLKQVGKPLAAVRAALRSNVVLRDLVTTPLMLSVVMLAYRGKTVKDLPQLGLPEEQQRQVFVHYVTRMLEQPTRKWRYIPDSTQKWVIWLAQQMKQCQLTEFYLEQLQPTWLLTKRTRIVHKVLVVLVAGLVAGLVGGLLLGLFFGLAVGPQVLLLIGLVVGLGGLVAGLVIGLFDVLLGELSKSQIQPSEKVTWSWNSFLQGLVGGLVGGLVIGLVIGLLYHGLLFGLVGGLTYGGVYGEVIGLILGLVRGGLAYLQHYCLRFLLWRSGAMPWRYVRFLEETTERILLQRVGGGYRFIHPLFWITLPRSVHQRLLLPFLLLRHDNHNSYGVQARKGISGRYSPISHGSLLGCC